MSWSDKKTLVRGLRSTDIAHYLEACGFDNSGPLQIIGEEVWQPFCGGDRTREDDFEAFHETATEAQTGGAA